MSRSGSAPTCSTPRGSASWSCPPTIAAALTGRGNDRLPGRVVFPELSPGRADQCHAVIREHRASARAHLPDCLRCAGCEGQVMKDDDLEPAQQLTAEEARTRGVTVDDDQIPRIKLINPRRWPRVKISAGIVVLKCPYCLSLIADPVD